MNESMEGYARAQKMGSATKISPDAVRIEQLVQARQRLSANDFNEEVELNDMAFLRYRYMTPYERTQEFYDAYRAHYARRFQRRNGRNPYGMAVKIIGLSGRNFTSSWRARQRADAIGIPYDQFVIAFFDYADDHGTDHLPALNQLCDDDKLPMVIKKHDDLIAAERIDPFEPGFDPRFYAVNYVGDSQQRAALDMLEAEINALGPASKADRLARHMKLRQLISEHEAIIRFSPELVEAAKAVRIGRMASPQVLESPHPTPPACIGLYRDAYATCMQCPAKSACIAQAGMIDAQVVARYGVLDVPAERKREGDCKRKRSERERKRSGKTMTDQERARILREAGDPKAKQKREKAKQRRDAKKALKAAEPEGRAKL